MDATTVLFLISITSILISATTAYVVFNRQSKKLDHLESMTDYLRKELNVLYNNTLKVHNRYRAMETYVKKVASKQDQQSRLTGKDSIPPGYDQAITMAKRGMGTDELVKILGIPRAEAELISLIHSVKDAS